ncbi:MAG: SsrA-binding protein SmpB [Deltaproteobacteria bacterium]|nr:SsrA-binding protein SmpB [Deltaproteobacteria bacterium]
MTDKPSGEKMIAGNRKAFHDFHIVEQFEAGLVLTGTEVKSLREGHASLQEGYVDIRNGEAWLVDVHIPPYSHGGYTNHEPFRQRKLLLHRRELEKLDTKVRERGYTVVPLKLYFSKGRAKLMIGLAKGKTFGDKREAMREEQDRRETDRAIRDRRRG